jgi:hypothetical protein
MGFMIITAINHSKNVTPGDLSLIVQANARQMRLHVGPTWGKYPASITLGTGGFPLAIFDTPDQASVLGYHSEGPDGRPYGKVFVQPVLDAGGRVLDGPDSIASVFSHEAIELFIDPACNGWAEAPNGRLYALEACDAVEGDSYVILIGGKAVTVSNFVLPAWFDANPSPGEHFDYLGKLTAPFTMTKGGYVIYRAAGSEKSVFAELGEEFRAHKMLGKKHPAARTSRRGASFPGSITPPGAGATA